MNKDPAIEDAQRLARRDKFTAADQRARDDESVCAAAFILYMHQFTTDEEQCPTEFQKAAVNELRRKWAEQCLPSLTARHCGDCTNVCAPCVRCFTERLMQDARALLTPNV